MAAQNNLRRAAHVGGNPDTLDVLHVAYTYWPDPVGGTEVYVRALASELGHLGLSTAVAAPGRSMSGDVLAGVFRWPVGPGVVDGASGRPDPASAVAFRSVLDAVKPRIVHLHARTSAVSTLLLDAAHAVGAKTVFTYHTPTASCMRGTMMLHGETSCDGRLDAARCTDCVLRKHGVPPAISHMLALAPVALGRSLGQAGLRRGPWLALRMRQLVEDAQRDFSLFMHRADRVVAVCDWVADVLRRNGIAEPRLVVSRQGLAGGGAGGGYPRPALDGPLRLAFFGRLSPEKGLDVLVSALRGLEGVCLDIFGIEQDGADAYVSDLMRMVEGSGHIRVRDGVPVAEVTREMSRFDMVAVPSVWLETGPLVVLEAFAASVPVIGSRLGGIAEIVRDGIDGRLVPAGDVDAWRAAVADLVRDPSAVGRLRAGVRQPRTMRDAAADMSRLYADLLGEAPRAA